VLITDDLVQADINSGRSEQIIQVSDDDEPDGLYLLTSTGLATFSRLGPVWTVDTGSLFHFLPYKRPLHQALVSFGLVC